MKKNDYDNQWRSVEDDPPSGPCACLVVFNGQVKHAYFHSEFDDEPCRFMSPGHRNTLYGELYDDATHWMPLPEPPE